MSRPRLSKTESLKKKLNCFCINANQRSNYTIGFGGVILSDRRTVGESGEVHADAAAVVVCVHPRLFKETTDYHQIQ
jgi:hypothetical protein